MNISGASAVSSLREEPERLRDPILGAVLMAFIGGGGEGVQRAVGSAPTAGDILPHGDPRICGEVWEGGVERGVDGAVQMLIEFFRLCICFGSGEQALTALVVLAVGDDDMLDAAFDRT